MLSCVLTYLQLDKSYYPSQQTTHDRSIPYCQHKIIHDLLWREETISFLRLAKMPELQFQIIDLKIMKADFTLTEERNIRR